MLNKIFNKKNMIFILYAWLIYNSYMIVMSPYIILKTDLIEYIKIVLMVFSGYHIIEFFSNFPKSVFNLHTVIVLMGMIVNAIPIFFWWKKPGIISAWLLAWTGAVAGQGLMFFFPNPYFVSHPMTALYGLLCLNLLYFTIFAVNFFQKKYWPDNKIINKIRFILKRPFIWQGAKQDEERSLSNISGNSGK